MAVVVNTYRYIYIPMDIRNYTQHATFIAEYNRYIEKSWLSTINIRKVEDKRTAYNLHVVANKLAALVE